jgi:hypothetical protein
MASNLQSCLTPGELTLKYWMKFSTSNCWQVQHVKWQLQNSCAANTIVICTVTLNHLNHRSPVYSGVCSRCVKQSIINFCSWVFDALEFRGFSLWKPIWGGKHTKSVLGNSEYSFHHFSSFKMKHVWELKKSLPTPMLASRKLYYICCNTIYRNVRPLSLLCPGSVFNCTPRIIQHKCITQSLHSRICEAAIMGIDKQDAGNRFYIISLSWTLPLEVNCHE